MKIDLSQFLDTFLEESAEHLAHIEAALLALEAAGQDQELLNGIFRAVHSIKGGAGTFGFTAVVDFSHVLESLLDKMRCGQLQVSPDLVALLLRANDVLKQLIADPQAACSAEGHGVLSLLAAASEEVGAPLLPAAKVVDAQAGQAPTNDVREVRVLFKPDYELFATGCNPLLLLRNLAGFGEVLDTVLDTSRVPPLAVIDTSACYLAWEVHLRTGASELELREVFEFVEDQARIEIEFVADRDPVPAAVAPSQNANAPRETPSIRVATEKIDRLIDLVGEMVIAQTMTAQIVDNFSPDSLVQLRACVASLERCVREFHEHAMSVRMLPIGTLFGRFQRMIHDLAEKTGKNIRLETAGEETEIDRAVLELLGDPLTHLIRNSVDHGIETAAERLRAGKAAEGMIRLRASHRPGGILLEIEDDGHGLDLILIREKALANGLISPEQTLSDEQLRALIFEPGFSTRSEVSDLSGRGFGMDVVKRNITSLNGNISVESEAGSGLAIRILLPLTLAIMDGLIIRVGSQHYVLPLNTILETIALRDEQITDLAGRGEVATVREDHMPLLRLKRLFHLDEGGEEDAHNLVVVVENGTKKAALLVDELLGQQQVVVKSIERNFRRVQGALGATILGDGSAALILDVAGLIDSTPRADRTHREFRRLSLVA